MRLVLGTLIGISCGALLFGQAPAAPPVTPGLLPDWDIRAILEEMSAHATRLQPVLAQIDAKSWIAKGASESYAAQLQSSKDQARAMAGDAKALTKDPEKLTACLELYFRIAGLDDMLASLEQGIRKYQDPALAQTLASVAAENGANRDRFRNYIVSLAAQREQVCAITDREAQRCRDVVASRPAQSAPQAEGKK
ncbi:MAG: hypothetical protein LAP40_18855 [Acidobacteriia bacterium]|nr:hypothetical protein [Terriglobia bacterium]